MKKDFLKGISKEVKKEFLSKLSSGNYILNKPYDPAPRLTFDLQESGMYKCNETGKELSKEEIESLPGYQIDIQLISERNQVIGIGTKAPDTIKKIPYSQDRYLNSLLKKKSDIHITFDESDRKFKSETESYSFNELMRFNHDNPEVKFIMDKVTAGQYAEFLKKWC